MSCGGDCRSFNSDIKTISVISSNNFDNSHPSGVVLNGVIKFLSITPYPYIESNYNSLFDWQNYWTENYTFPQGIFNFGNETHLIDKRLSELNQNGLILAGDAQMTGCLLFTQNPTLEQTHNLTVTIELQDSRTFEKTIKKNI
jgi:hypothetical protein